MAMITTFVSMEIKNILKPDGSNVVDVRMPEEFRMGHVRGSVNIPMNEVEERLDELRAMGTPLLLCCASGARSGNVTVYLKECGLQDVYNAGSWLTLNGLMPL
jgi:rhodanese-related sulfurtransferase